MKTYAFKLNSDNIVLKKKSFKISLKNCVTDTEEIIDSAILYLQNNCDKFFDLSWGDEYIRFELVKGKQKIHCELWYEYCHKCGGEVSIYWNDPEDI